MNDTEEVSLDQVREGDKITATFTTTGPAGEYTITGRVWESAAGHNYVGKRFVANATKIVRHVPDWRDAEVVEVAGKRYALVDPHSRTGLRWATIKSGRGYDGTWRTDEELAYRGEVKIIIDADGRVVGS